MADSVNVEVPTDADELYQQIVDEIQEDWPDWEPHPGNLETRLISAFARVAGDMSIFAANVAQSVFLQFGQTIANIPPQLSAAAQGETTWLMKDDAGYTIEAGTMVTVAESGSDDHAFTVINQVIVPPGDTLTEPGEVLIQAVINGEQANGLTGDPELATSVPDNYLGDTGGISLIDPTSGGADAETEEDYVDRLVEELQLMSPRPILTQDFAVLAQRNPSVHRAIAINGWDGTDTDNERTVGLVLMDENGEDVSAGVKTEVEEYLESLREVNFVIYIGEPTYTPIFVTTTVRCYTGFAPADVDANVTAAITNYLDPANWGVKTVSPSYGTNWRNETVVRQTELVALVNNVSGVDYVESLTLGTSTAPGGTADVTLSGDVPLTRPAETGTGISVTANPAT